MKTDLTIISSLGKRQIMIQSYLDFSVSRLDNISLVIWGKSCYIDSSWYIIRLSRFLLQVGKL